MNLPPKQEKFCQEYIKTGNASEAYRRAYPRAQNWKPVSVHVRSCKLLENANVQIRIDELRQKINDEAIADIIERQKFWTEIMRNPGQETKDRLKASELLAKCQGDFVERREISGMGGGPVQINIQHVAAEESID